MDIDTKKGVFYLKKNITRGVEFMKKTREFLIGVKKEMDKVHWPTKKEMITYSVATLSFILIFAVFFMLSDTIIAMFKLLVN